MDGGLHTHRAVLRAPALVFAAFTLTLIALAFQTPTPTAAEEATVITDGGCLRLRAQPSLDATIVTCIAEGSTVDAEDEQIEADGHAWQRVTVNGRVGWVASRFLSSQAPAADQPVALPVPPVGGLTIGRSGTSSVDALIAAQPFEALAIFVLDIDSQQFRMYNPAIAVRAGTFTLGPDDIVLVRRDSSDRTRQAADTPVAFASLDGPSRLPVPPRDGLTAGVAGTDDIAALIGDQLFTVDLVAVWDVDAQQWTMHRPDAPSFTNSLTRLTPSTPVFLRRDADAPDPDPPQATEPPAPPSPPASSLEPREERITYYYCERGENLSWWGDGGGWCGAMANGELAHEGAASCARHLMGQQFVILADPLERVYTCKDTGGGVTKGHRDIWFRDSDTAGLWWDEVGPTAVVIPLEP